MGWSKVGWSNEAGWYKPVADSSIPFDLDGTPQTANTGGGTSVALPAFSTVYPDSIVYVALINNGGAPSAPTASGLTFALRSSFLSGATTVSLWYAIAAAPLSSVVVTANQASADYMTAAIFAFSGAKSSAPFDTNASVPFTGNPSPPISTDNANDIIVAAGVTTSAIDAPFTPILPGALSNFLSVGYFIASSTQSSLPPTFGGGGVNTTVDAIVKGP